MLMAALLACAAAEQTVEGHPERVGVVFDPPEPDPLSPYFSGIQPRAVRSLSTEATRGWGPRGEVGTSKKVKAARKRQKQARKANR